MTSNPAAIAFEADAPARPARRGLLQDFPAHWAFWWVVMPNIMAIAMWPLGGPGMAFSMCLCGVAAILLSFSRSVAVRRAGLVVIVLFNALMYVAYSFNLDIVGLFRSVDFLVEMNPADSPEYIVAGVVLLIALGLILRFAPRSPRFGSVRQVLLGVGALALLVNVDTLVTSGTRGSYKAKPAAGTPIDSAILQNRVSPQTVAARNLVVIIVEALGVPNNDHDRALFENTWGAARWSARYDVRSGVSAYYGSTTNAELREWCGVWADQFSFDFQHADCLPSRFARAGFRTTSFHAFAGGFFDREAWYPRIGFQDRRFGANLEGAGTGHCGGVFPGACDRAVPRLIGDLLRSEPEQRHLVYWLTLNSHLPVPADSSLGTKNCRMGDAGWSAKYPLLCRSYLLQLRTADAIHAEIMASNFPESDILIVGDHMPPFFQRTVRSRFDPTSVPWIYLRNREAMRRAEAAGDGLR